MRILYRRNIQQANYFKTKDHLQLIKNLNQTKIMKRYNAFYLIHKGLRAMLYDAALTLQQTDFADAAETVTALAKVNDVLFAFDRHAHHEDSFIIPAVEAYEPELAASFAQEHEEDHRLAGYLKNLLTIYDNTFFPEEKSICGSAIIKSFTEFLVFNLQHMAREEMLLNQALWKHYTDEQIIAIQQQLLASIPPVEMQASAKWMIRAISNADAIDWLKKIKQTAPEFVFNNLLNIAAEELSEARFEIIHEGIEEAVAA
jgi:hypothetical protein